MGALNNIGKYATNTIALGVGTNVFKENSVAIGTGVNVTGAGAIAIGSGVGVTKDNTISIGYGSHGLSGESIVLGNDASLKENAGKSIVIGNSAKVENKNSNTRSGNSNNTDFSAIAIGTSSNVTAQNSIALGNKADVSMKNSVALGYQSTTNYFYNNNKSIATLTGSNAIDLPGYFPQGSSYETKTDSASGIVSVGGWNNNGKVGFRRIVNVAAGALDSDVATVGQLKTLAYVKKEGVVTYYTTVNGETQKLVKSEQDNKFYRVNTENGEPLEKLGPVENKNVLAGPKGQNEVIKIIDGKKTANMGDLIKFGHLAKGEISATSDQAITGAQLDDLKGNLGLQVNAEKTGFDKVLFESVEYISTPESVIGKTGTFKAALDETIKAINQGYKFSDGKVHQQPFYLGATIEIKAGDSDNGFKGKNLKTKFKSENKNSKAIFEIGLREAPSFKSVTIEDTINEKSNEKLAVNKKYVDDKFKNVATSFNVSGNTGKFKVTNQLGIKGEGNISTNASGNEVKISLKEALTGITSITGKNGNSGNKIDFTNSDGLKLSSKSGSTITLKSDGLDLGSKKITHLVDGTQDTDAVNFKQLKEAKLHFVSVKHPSDANSKYNYTNNGATQEGAVAIGVGAKADAKNAVAIGHNASIDVSSSFVMGSNNVVTQGDKDTRSAVVVIGSGTKLENSKSSIAIGAVFVETSKGKDGTVIENAAWTTAIGNKIKVKNGTDIVALGNNINVEDKTNDTAKNGTKNANSNLVLVGNAAKAESAKESVIVGAKAEAKTKATQSVVIGYEATADKNAVGAVVVGKGAKAETNATGAVAIGEGATVSTSAGDSIALGKDSKATKQEKSDSEYTVSTLKNLKFTSFSGHGTNKSVLSIGDTGKERLIKHVAPGTISATSTDAINGSQLYSVIDVFGNLGATVLGAEVDATKGFKQSTFENVKYKDGGSDQKNTFKAAIDETIKAINKGLIISDGDTPARTGTLQLGDTLHIQAGNIDSGTFKSDNIKTSYQPSTKKLFIGIKDSPAFKSVTVTDPVNESSKAETLTTKKYVDEKVNNLSSNLKFQADSGGEKTLSLKTGTLKVKGASSQITTSVEGEDTIKIGLDTKITTKINDTADKASKNEQDITAIKTSITEHTQKIADQKIKYKANGNSSNEVKLSEGLDFYGDDNITTSPKAGGRVDISLNKELKGITSIANGDNAKIALGKDSKTITFTSGDNKDNVTLEGSTLSGVSEINKGTDKGALKLEDDSATLSAGKGKGSIKVSNGTENKIELSPESGSTVTLAKDGTNGVKATGLSTIGKDNDNALVFKNGTDSTKTAELKVGGNALTFTPVNGTENSAKYVKISNVAAGQIDKSSTDAISGKQLADLATKLGVTVDSSSKTGFTAPSFTAINGGVAPTTHKGAIDKLITAVNGGLTFKGNDNTNSPSSTKLQLGGALTFDSSESETGEPSKKEKDITITATPNGTDAKDAGKLTLKLSKSEAVKSGDKRVVTSDAVAEELKKYTTTATLGTEFLKVSGENIGKDDETKKQGRKTFGGNVGISKISLDSTAKSSTELVQAQAVIDYLKGTGKKSVKISDNPETKADGEGSIAVGDKAIAQNAGSISIGQNAGAKNDGAVSIGKDSDVTAIDGIAIGKGSEVSGQSSVALGETNIVSGVQSYVIGSDNTIKGRDVVALGSRITAEAEVTNAVILGANSKGESNTVSVGGLAEGQQRRIINVDSGLKLTRDDYDTSKNGEKASVKVEKAKEKIATLLTQKYNDSIMRNAATVRDLQALATSGLYFYGNDGEKIHKKLSQELRIKGDGVTQEGTKSFASATGNINVKKGENGKGSDEDAKQDLVIQLSKALKNMTSFETDPIKHDGDGSPIKTQIKLDGTGLTVTHQADKDGEKVQTQVGKDGTTIKELDKDGSPKPNGKSASYTLDKAELKASDNGNTFENTQTAKGNDLVKKSKDNPNKELASNKQTAEDITLSKDNGAKNKIDADGMTVGDKDGTHATYDKNGLTIAGQDGQSAVSLTTKNDNGKDTATLAFATNGTDDKKSGTGKITGLADVTDKDGRDVATNKGYVDDLLAKSNHKLEDIDANRPFVFMLQENGQDVEVVKGRDGKLYKKTDLAEATYNKVKQQYTKADGTMVSALTDDAVQKVAIKARSVDPNNKPIVIGNVASGLDPEKVGKKAASNDGKAEAITAETARELIVGKNGSSKGLNHLDLVSELNKVATIGDLQALSLAGVGFKGSSDQSPTYINLGNVVNIYGNAEKSQELADRYKAEIEKAQTPPNGTEDKNAKLFTQSFGKNIVTTVNPFTAGEIVIGTVERPEFTGIDVKSTDPKAKTSTTITHEGTAVLTKEGDTVQTTVVDKDGLKVMQLGDNASPNKVATYGLDKLTMVNGENTATLSAEDTGSSLVLSNKDNNVVELKAENERGSLALKHGAKDSIQLTAASDDEAGSLTVKNQDGNQDSVKITGASAENAATVAVKNNEGQFRVEVSSGKGEELGKISLKDKEGTKDLVTLSAGNGTEGPTLKFAKGADNQSGTGAITGLKDLDDNADGTSAVNKNYVDEKVKSLDGNRPFDYYIKEGEKYVKVVKGQDGKFYKPNDLEGATYDNKTQKYTKGDKEVESTFKDKQLEVVIKAEPTATPMTVTNIKDGDLTDKSSDAVNGAQLVKATGAKLIDDPDYPSKKKMVFADGKDGLSGLEKTSDGKKSMAAKGLTGKDGLNGKNANDKANALRDGEAGTVVFTDKYGNRLVKTNDGEYYKADDVNADGSVKKTDGQDAPKPVDTPQLSLVNPVKENKPVVLGNVASGLGIDAEKVKQAEEEVKAKRSEAERKATLLEAKTAVMTQKEEKVTTLKQEIENLSGDEKTQKEAELKAIEAELSQLNDELATATKDLKTANDALKIANNTLTNLTEDKIGNLVKGENINSTNGANIGDLQAVARAGLNFEGNDGVPVHKNLGENLTIKGEGTFNSDNTAAGNIKVEIAQDGKGLEVKLSDRLKNMTSFETREVNGRKSTLNSNGLKVVDQDSEAVVTAQGTRIAGKGNHAGQSASYTLDGIQLQGKAGEPSLMATHAGLMVSGNNGNIVINGNRGEILIPDVKPDASGFVAVNKNYVDSQNNALRTQIHHADRRLRAGIAGANAAAALASVSMPGKSMVAIAAAGHDGESALAIGYSRISDNGKVMLKLQGNSNSQGKVSGAVSIGYQW
ncbi:YadA-like family protein [Histophilus somni]|uniref:YadA-like family protein n=1 Tax=Histophilus somni TaxID=731 RepID=UPI00094B3227|nr:YadA-like family protein [Histophilus somni]